MDPGFSPDDFPRMEPAEPGQIIERNPDSRSSDGDATDSTGISDTVEPASTSSGIADTVEPGEIIEIGVDSSSSDDDATDTEEGSTFSGFSPRRDQIDTLEPGEIIERTLNSLRRGGNSMENNSASSSGISQNNFCGIHEIDTDESDDHIERSFSPCVFIDLCIQLPGTSRNPHRFLPEPQPEEVQEPEPEPNPKEDDDDDDDDPSPAKRSRKQDASYRCPICLESPMHREPTVTNCGHVFCKVCILRAIDASHKCPICKNKISKFDIHRIYM
ncbi:uncharacterized protein LOC6644497 isoform X3 [Drosophila willistoni]|nr:uncharacterized protein LOC6644497 isoform X3 [Drosophila willistoni]